MNFEKIQKYARANRVLDLTVNCRTVEELGREKANKIFNGVWEERGMWEIVPPGVGKVRFENGIVVNRKGADENSAEWTLEDLNAYYGLYFKDNFKPWEPIVPRKVER